MERYYRVVRNCAKAVPIKQELTKRGFECAVWNEANWLAWEDNPDTYEIQQEHCDKYYEALLYATHTLVAEYEEDEYSYHIRVEGGTDIGDYTYYLVTDDRIIISDLPRRN